MDARPLIAFNLLFLVPGDTGGLESYARRLVPELVRQGDEFRFMAVTSSDAANWRGLEEFDIPVTILPVHAHRREQWVFGEQILLPRELRRAGASLLHNLGATGPLRGSTPMVTTTHDMIYHRIPEAEQGLRGRGMRALVPRVARRSRAVITSSESAADDIAQIAGVPREGISVIPIAAGEPTVTPLAAAAVRAAVGATDRQLVLYPTAVRPHKNIAGLLRALAQIDPTQRPVVAIPGYETTHAVELRRLAAELGVEDDVRLLGWVSVEMLEGLFAAADALVFPSRYEGFGLPILEAMQRRLPVVCSRVSSMPEVAGDSAEYFDPSDSAEIAAAMMRVLGDSELRSRMAERGVQRAKDFSWSSAASGTLAVYRRLL